MEMQKIYRTVNGRLQNHYGELFQGKPIQIVKDNLLIAEDVTNDNGEFYISYSLAETGLPTDPTLTIYIPEEGIYRALKKEFQHEDMDLGTITMQEMPVKGSTPIGPWNGKPPLSGPNRDPWPSALWDHPMPDIRNVVLLDVKQGQDITVPLQNALANHTRVEIPSGEYLLSDRTVLGGRWEHLHVKGLGDAPGGVVLDLGVGQEGGLTMYTNSDGGVLLLENIDFVGTVSGESRGLRVDARHPNSELILKHFRFMGGEEPGPNGTGIYSGSQRNIGGNGNEGVLRFLWCMSNNFGDNAMYLDGPNSPTTASAPNAYGQVIIVGGLFSNSNISQIRLGTPYATVYGATIVLDDPRELNFGTQNFRGMRWRQPDGGLPPWPEYNHLFVQSDIYFDDVPTGGGRPMMFESQLSKDSNGMVKNVRIYNDRANPSIGDATSWGIDSTWEFHNIHLTGEFTGVHVELQNSPEPNSEEAEAATPEPWWGN